MGCSQETINHPAIGPMQGNRRCPNVTQFLGVQYATLKDMFARGELLEQYQTGPAGALDATKLGPTPLLPANACDHEQKLIQQKLPHKPLRQADTECLTLNISVPDLDDRSLFPVVVFIHGGAFATGSSSFPQCDLGPITSLSVEIDQPMICVGVNYRVGVPGFLHSSAMKDAGYRTNNGLADQKLALAWVKRHISGFGGDPSRVTLLGESAGAASGVFHLHHEEDLFHQFVAMSGSFVQRLRLAEQAEMSYTSVLGVLGATDLSPKEQIQKVLETPGEEIVERVGRRFPMAPVIDGESIPVRTTFNAIGDKAGITKLLPGLRHCKRLLVGDCQLDGMAFSFRVAGRTDILPRTLIACLSKTLDPIDPRLAKDIVSAYNIDGSAGLNTRENLEPVLHFGNDIMFALPARQLARAWSASRVPGAEAFLCHFNAPNPWEGPWRGHASHIQDLAFVLMNSHGSLSSGQRLCAERYAIDIISFVNGGAPWPAYETGGKDGAMVYFASQEADRDGSGYIPVEDPEHTGRRDHLVKIVGEALLDKLVDAWQMFMAGPR